MTEDRLHEILGFCRKQEIVVKRMRITIEDLTQYYVDCIEPSILKKFKRTYA